MPYEQRSKTPHDKVPHEMVGQGASEREVDADASRKQHLRSMDYNAGKASLQPKPSQSVEEVRRLQLMRGTAESMRSEYLRYWIPSAHRHARTQMGDERHEQESAALGIDSVQAVPGTNVPDANRWGSVLHQLSKAQEAMAEGDLQMGLQLYKDALERTLLEAHRWGGGAGSTALALETSASASRVERDLDFAANASVADVVVPPLTGVRSLDPGVLTEAPRAASAAVISGDGGALGELLATDAVDWTALGNDTWTGLKDGMIEGGFAVLRDAPSSEDLLELSPSHLALQTGSRFRQAAAEAISTGGSLAIVEALHNMSEEALNYATSADFRAKWSRDPSAAFAEFRSQMESSGASGFQGGAASRGGQLNDLELELLHRRKSARIMATELTYGGYKTLEAYLRAVCGAAFQGLSPATIQALSALCQERLLKGEPPSVEAIGLELQRLEGSHERVEAMAADVSQALADLDRAE